MNIHASKRYLTENQAGAIDVLIKERNTIIGIKRVGIFLWLEGVVVVLVAMYLDWSYNYNWCGIVLAFSFFVLLLALVANRKLKTLAPMLDAQIMVVRRQKFSSQLPFRN